MGRHPAGLTPAGLTAYATPTKRKEARDNLAGFFVPTNDPGGDRTHDLRLKRPLLYQLSYRVGYQ